MFDYATARASGPIDASRVATTVISLSLHLVVVGALVVSALWATGSLPEPPAMMAFVVDAVPPPPPPPPAPPPAVVPKPVTATTRRVAAPPPRILPNVPTVGAPTEVPTGITAETGLEQYSGLASTVAAGFETGIDGGVAGGVVGGIDRAVPPPPPPPVVKKPVRVGGHVTAPRLVRRVAPEYPLIAQSAQIEGTVILEASVGADGHVDDVRALRSHSVLERAAMDAVRQWEYEPLVLNGEPQPFILTVTVSFHLDRPQ